MRRIGITGGIGSGKSIVSRLFQVLGVPIYDADTRARWLMENDAWLRQQLRAAFGHDIYDASNQLNRPLLARLVFPSSGELARLNGLVHPRVGDDFEAWAREQQAAGQAYVLKEAAPMFESGSYRQLDEVVVVSAPWAIRQARVLRRDPHRTADDVLAIMAKQMPEEEKVARAQHVIVNDDARLLIPQVLALHQLFTQPQP